MNHFTFKTCNQDTDRQAIEALFYAIRDELYLPDAAAARAVTERVFAHGGATGGYAGEQLVGVLGYFFGDPAQAFANKEVLFLYVGAILQPYRGTGLFKGGLVYTLRQMRAKGVKAIRLQAEIGNPFTNRLYGRFAQFIGEGKSMRGHAVNTYGAALEDALAALERKKRRPASQHGAPHSRLAQRNYAHQNGLR